MGSEQFITQQDTVSSGPSGMLRGGLASPRAKLQDPGLHMHRNFQRNPECRRTKGSGASLGVPSIKLEKLQSPAVIDMLQPVREDPVQIPDRGKCQKWGGGSSLSDPRSRMSMVYLQPPGPWGLAYE